LVPRALICLPALLLLLCPAPAPAAFISINGLDRGELQRGKVSVALTSIKDVTVTWKTSYARSGHLELTLQETLFGAKPPAGAFKKVPFTSGVGYNSAWPELGASPAGSFLIMAWRNGHPCGEGSAVHLGERFSLPMLVTGATDPRLTAVRDALKLVSIAEESARGKKLGRIFAESSNPYLVLFADAALSALEPQHRASAERYARLLGILNGTPGADEELGWPLLQELTRFPALRDSDAYDIWKQDCHAGPTADGSWPSFAQFRRLIQTRFRGFAANAKAGVDLRRWAVTALAAPPSFVAVRKDRLDAAAIGAVSERLRDPVVEVRRDAVRGLLSMAAALKPNDRAASRRLLAQVRQALRKETDPEEKANLQLRLDEIAGSSEGNGS
jgi:hypothetical protein